MTTLFALPPFVWLLLSGLGLFFTPTRPLRLALLIAAPLMTLWQLGTLDAESTPLILRFIRYDLLPFTLHPYSLIFATAFALATLAGGLFAHHARVSRHELALGHLSAAAGLAILFAGDYITLFIAWESLAVASLFLIWLGRRPDSGGAGLRYALVHLLGGMLLLGGITLLATTTDTTLLSAYHLRGDKFLWLGTAYSHDIEATSLAIWLILAGVAINAGVPPFSSWIADAYPESSPSGMVFLTTFTTKAAIFVLLTLFNNTELFIWIGLLMMAHGVIYAMLENDMRRLLCYVTLSQLGMLLVGIGLDSTLAGNAVATHAFNHILYSCLLTMVAGAVMLEHEGRSTFTALSETSPRPSHLRFFAVIGVLSMAGVPLTGGYVGKSMLGSAAGDVSNAAVWYGITLLTAATVIAGAWRFLWFGFFTSAEGEKRQNARIPVTLAVTLLGTALLTLIPGLLPAQYLAPLLPDQHHTFLGLYSAASQVVLLLFASTAFFFFLPLLQPKDCITLDIDWTYRRLLVKTVFSLEKLLGLGYIAVTYANRRLMQFITACIVRLTGPGGLFAETRTLANSTLIVAVLLAGYLLLYHHRD
ncbi:MAG: hypothetical protein FJX23_04525 [Alphaproteobacteria bacterium]|nr:hypothetical protein [Alphaproteobacteria bacterium]